MLSLVTYLRSKEKFWILSSDSKSTSSSFSYFDSLSVFGLGDIAIFLDTKLVCCLLLEELDKERL